MLREVRCFGGKGNMKNRRIFLSSENLLLSDIIEYLTVEGSENYIASAAPIQAKMERRKIIPINDIIRPATAKPLGLLKMPMNEKIRPNTQTIQPNTGIQRNIGYASVVLVMSDNPA